MSIQQQSNKAFLSRVKNTTEEIVETSSSSEKEEGCFDDDEGSVMLEKVLDGGVDGVGGDVRDCMNLSGSEDEDEDEDSSSSSSSSGDDDDYEDEDDDEEEEEERPKKKQKVPSSPTNVTGARIRPDGNGDGDGDGDGKGSDNAIPFTINPAPCPHGNGNGNGNANTNDNDNDKAAAIPPVPLKTSPNEWTLTHLRKEWRIGARVSANIKGREFCGKVTGKKEGYNSAYSVVFDDITSPRKFWVANLLTVLPGSWKDPPTDRCLVNLKEPKRLETRVSYFHSGKQFIGTVTSKNGNLYIVAFDAGQEIPFKSDKRFQPR